MELTARCVCDSKLNKKEEEQLILFLLKNKNSVKRTHLFNNWDSNVITSRVRKMKNEMERINATLDFLQQSEKKWMNTGQSHKIEY